MSTLTNFHTGNAGRKQEAWHPTRDQRLMVIQKNLANPRAWDLPNLVPIGPIQQSNPPILSGNHVDPQVSEIRNIGAATFFLPISPYTRVMQGDTADGRLLYKPPEQGTLWSHLRTLWSPNKAPVQTRLPTDIY